MRLRGWESHLLFTFMLCLPITIRLFFNFENLLKSIDYIVFIKPLVKGSQQNFEGQLQLSQTLA